MPITRLNNAGPHNIIIKKLGARSKGVYCSSTVNIHVRAQKRYYLEQACTKCTYKSHIAIKQDVDIHEVGELRVYVFMHSRRLYN